MARSRWILRFLAGPRLGDSVPLPTGTTLTIGRGRDCVIRLPESNCHRLHASISWRKEIPALCDAGGRNGIFRNGHKVTDSPLHHWDMLVIGASVMRVEDREQIQTAQTSTEARGGTTDRTLTQTGNGTSNSTSSGTSNSSSIEQSTDRPLFDAEHRRTGRDAQRNRAVADYERLFECLLTIQGILNEPDDANLVDRSLETLFAVLPATRLSLLTIEPDGQLLQRYTLSPAGPTSEYIGTSFAKRVLAEGRPLLMEDANISDQDWGRTIQDQHVQSILGAPIMGERGPLGVLLADNRESPGSLRDKHLKMIEFAVRAIGAAFQRRDLRDLLMSQAQASAELDAARQVQAQLFNKDPAKIDGPVIWRARYQPAESVGGDYYDFHRHADGTTWVIADVTGHGVSAALVVSMLKGFCKLLHPQQLAPIDYLRRLNDCFAGELHLAMFLTAAVFTLRDDGELRYASLGHPPMLHLPSDGRIVELHSSPGFLGRPTEFGMLKRLEEHQLHLQPGERLLACSDGLLEAGPPDGMFGNGRLQEVLRETHGRPMDEVLDQLLTAVAAHAPRQADDITLVIGGR